MTMRDRRRPATSDAGRADRRPAGPDEETVRIARKDFRRRRNAGRWRRVRLVAAGAGRGRRWSRRRSWLVFFSCYVTARGVEVTGTRRSATARVERRRGRADRRRRWPASTSTRSRPGSSDSPRSRRVDGLAQLAARGPHRRHRAARRRRGRPRGEGLAGAGRRRACSSAATPLAPAALPLVDAPARHAPTRPSPRRPGRSARCRADIAAQGRPVEVRTRRQDRAGAAATAAGCCGGARRTPARRPRCSPCCSSQPGPADRRLRPGPARPDRADAPRCRPSTQPARFATLSARRARVLPRVRRVGPPTLFTTSG